MSLERAAGDAHAQIAHLGEVRQAEPAWLMRLAEDHFLLGAIDRPPSADPSLKRAPRRIPVPLEMAARHLLEHADRPQAGRRLQQRRDLAVEDVSHRIWASPTPCSARPSTGAPEPAVSYTPSPC